MVRVVGRIAVAVLLSGLLGCGGQQAPGLDICRSFEWLRFSRRRSPDRSTCDETGYRLMADVPGTVPLPGAGLAISLELIEKTEISDSIFVYNGGMAFLDWRRLSGSLELRNWRPGDRYRPSGSGGAEKIKTLLQQARIPVWERRRWPVLMDGASIVWARLFGPAAEFAAGPGSSTILKIREVVAR